MLDMITVYDALRSSLRCKWRSGRETAEQLSCWSRPIVLYIDVVHNWLDYVDNGRFHISVAEYYDTFRWAMFCTALHYAWTMLLMNACSPSTFIFYCESVLHRNAWRVIPTWPICLSLCLCDGTSYAYVANTKIRSPRSNVFYLYHV